jgi:O-antigen/teichoic acid export membrane protein
VLGLTLPVTLTCALFADDLVLVLLGPNWKDSAGVVRLLAPTISIFAIINPLGWLIYSLGLVKRSLKIALVFAPLMITGYVMGLPYGPKGVAFAYSAVLTLWAVPHILWCVHGTPISFWDILQAVRRPLVSSLLAGAVALGVRLTWGQFFPPFVLLVVESGVLFVVFFGVLLFAAGQKSLYLDLLRGLRGSSTVAEEFPVSSALSK